MALVPEGAFQRPALVLRSCRSRVNVHTMFTKDCTYCVGGDFSTQVPAEVWGYTERTSQISTCQCPAGTQERAGVRSQKVGLPRMWGRRSGWCSADKENLHTGVSIPDLGFAGARSRGGAGLGQCVREVPLLFPPKCAFADPESNR